MVAIVVFCTIGLNFGIDFRGGVDGGAVESRPGRIWRVRATVGGLGLGEVSLQGFGEPNGC